MELAGASAGAASGVVMEAGGYPMLALGAAVAAAPIVLLLMHRSHRDIAGDAAD